MDKSRAVPDWRGLANEMWHGSTIQQACANTGEDYGCVSWHLSGNPDLRALLLDVSMLASVREELINEIAKG